MDDLTKIQKKVLLTLYREYLKTKSNYFGDSDSFRDSLFPNFSNDELSDICWSLHSKSYLTCEPGDDFACDVKLSDKTIIYMENRFKNGFVEVTDFLSKFIP